MGIEMFYSFSIQHATPLAKLSERLAGISVATQNLNGMHGFAGVAIKCVTRDLHKCNTLTSTDVFEHVYELPRDMTILVLNFLDADLGITCRCNTISR